LLAFVPTIVWMVQSWLLPDSYFAHGPLLILAGLWFLLERRRQLAAAPRVPSRLGLLLLALALLLHLAGQALMVDSLSGLSFVPALLAFILAFEGRARLRIAAAPLCCFFFAVPLPLFVSGKIAYGLKHVATQGAVFLGNLFGLGLEQEGARILVPGQELPLLIGDNCSGLRSLTALISLGYLFAFFLSPRKPAGRLLFLAIAAPLALVVNFVRIAVLAALAGSRGVAFATGTAHEVSGYAIYLGAIVVLLLLDRVLPGRTLREPAPSPEGGGPAAEPGRVRPLATLVLALLGLPAAVLGCLHPAGLVRPLAALVPRQSEHFVAVRDHPLSERWYRMLGTRDVCWRSYEHRSSARRVVLTNVFHGRNWKSVHPPQVCLKASGFELMGEENHSFEIPEERLTCNVLTASYRKTRYMIAYVYGGPDFTTPSYFRFFLRNLPKTILRRPIRGFLLRVDMPWPGSMPRDDAEALLGSFLAEYLPPVQRLLAD
ncbi:MAG: exosortase C-terminal domain/associated protein EpsI, partial [Planctomycetota bacterium]